ncbi:hypothetical protein BDQ12DRAFT_685169 [Crucibulum laeve]|uniref:Uncharacterized protein n=1 Tax=Crucibulum laeve TaxID=68775 RepID=A0A5C3LVR6_9AGAR|nr:hypothetical protein BDQ12DRAFT_685169 [Crucibulum laeve]
MTDWPHHYVTLSQISILVNHMDAAVLFVLLAFSIFHRFPSPDGQAHCARYPLREKEAQRRDIATGFPMSLRLIMLKFGGLPSSSEDSFLW